MPIITLTTNVPLEKFPPTFKKTLIELLAEILIKPVEGISLHLISDSNYSFGITDHPAVHLNVKAIGRLSAEENIQHAQSISEHVEKNLQVPPSRILIHFQNLELHEVALHGKTVQELRKSIPNK